MPVIDDEVHIESLHIVGNAILNIQGNGSLTFDGMHYLAANITLTSEMMAGSSKLSYTDLALGNGTDSDHPVVRTSNTPF